MLISCLVYGPAASLASLEKGQMTFVVYTPSVEAMSLTCLSLALKVTGVLISRVSLSWPNTYTGSKTSDLCKCGRT